MSRIKRRKLTAKVSGSTEPEKKGISKQAIWTIILGGTMVFSIFGIMFSGYDSGKQEYTYNDRTFQRTNTGWSTGIDDKMIEFNYLPQEVESINISTEPANILKESKVIYITFNPNNKSVQQFELARLQLGLVLSDNFQIYAMPGITEPSSLYQQPIADCNNATQALPVVKFIDSNETKAYVENDCVIIEAEKTTVLAVKDKILYQMLGIMD